MLRDNITDCILLYQKDHDEYYVAGMILELLAPELEKARVLDEAREFLNTEEGKEVCNMVELVWIYNQLASIVLTKKEVGYVSVDKLG